MARSDFDSGASGAGDILQIDPDATLAAAACLDQAADRLQDFVTRVGERYVIAPGGDLVSAAAAQHIQAALQAQAAAAISGIDRFRNLSAGLREYLASHQQNDQLVRESFSGRDA